MSVPVSVLLSLKVRGYIVSGDVRDDDTRIYHALNTSVSIVSIKDTINYNLFILIRRVPGNLPSIYFAKSFLPNRACRISLGNQRHLLTKISSCILVPPVSCDGVHNQSCARIIVSPPTNHAIDHRRRHSSSVFRFGIVDLRCRVREIILRAKEMRTIKSLNESRFDSAYSSLCKS